MNNLSKEQVILVVNSLLDGHQAIYRKLGATSVSLDKAGITKNGQVKVWIHQELDRNDISGEILTSEEIIVKRIFELVDFLAGNRLDSLKHYILDNLERKKNARWTFSALKAMLKSYSQCLHMKIPLVIENYQDLGLQDQPIKPKKFDRMGGSLRYRTMNHCSIIFLI